MVDDFLSWSGTGFTGNVLIDKGGGLSVSEASEGRASKGWVGSGSIKKELHHYRKSHLKNSRAVSQSLAVLIVALVVSWCAVSSLEGQGSISGGVINADSKNILESALVFFQLGIATFHLSNHLPITLPTFAESDAI